MFRIRLRLSTHLAPLVGAPSRRNNLLVCSVASVLKVLLLCGTWDSFLDLFVAAFVRFYEEATHLVVVSGLVSDNYAGFLIV